MPDSPLAAGPYQVLGVAGDASQDEVRRAYRRRLRETHPDAGGSAAEFDAVQRAWAQIGTPEDRRAYDHGRRGPHSESRTEPESRATWAPRPAPSRRDSRPPARAYGHPGGWHRERYLDTVQEWVGRGVSVDDPYDPALVRSAPLEIRQLLASALAEEASARQLATLGIGFTLWHDVATPSGKLDSVALGPTGLWGIRSADFGAAVAIHRGELVGAGVAPGERPVHALSQQARALARSARVRFSALVIVVPDDETVGVREIGTVRGAVALLCERSRLADLLRTGLPGVGVGGTDLFELRTRLQAVIRFV